MKKFFLYLAALMLLPSCHRTLVTSRRTLNFKKEAVSSEQTKATTTPYITIWIHGTRGFRPLDEIVHAAPPGSNLQTITSLSNNYNRFKKLTKTIADADPIKYPFEHFYIFGWSGALSFKTRHTAAATLHQELEQLVATYTKKYGHAPFIRLITHSHGGNVALNLATIEHPNKDWFINEMILLACPVQHETENLIASPLFGKVYSLYSTIDSLQVCDPQGLYKKTTCAQVKRDLFSHRRFPDHEKLMQTKLRINNHGVSHIGFINNRFIRHLPAIVSYLNQWDEEKPHSTKEVRQLAIMI